MEKIRIFTGLDRWPTTNERWLVGFVRAAIDPAGYSARVQKYGARAEIFEAVDLIRDADAAVLPFVWDYYVKHRRTRQALDFAHTVADADKQLLVWNGGDLEAVVPIPNAIQFGHGPHRSLRRVPPRIYAFPQFKPDWLETYCGGEIRTREWRPKPTVGFCGLASQSWVRLTARTFLTLLHICRFRLGCANYVPTPARSPIALRRCALDILSLDSRVGTDFIIRDRYRGGLNSASEDESMSKARLEYVNNILNTDYTICVRGVGNFSARLYETLCLGRIPVFINTDCVLPYDFTVAWREYCVWVDVSQLEDLPGILLEFHHQHSGPAFVELQHACRRLWIERLSSSGFYGHFYEHLRFPGDSRGPQTTDEATI